MPYIQKKVTRGRRRNTAVDNKATADERSRDGARLRSALGVMSQYEAADLAGIPQGHISGIINGDRAIGREDLRKLGRIGISADYLLGLVNTMVPPRQARTNAALESDVAVFVERALDMRYPTSAIAGEEPFVWRVRGSAALEAAIDGLDAGAQRAYAVERRNPENLRRAKALHRAVAVLVEQQGDAKGDIGATIRSLFKQADELLSASRRELEEQLSGDRSVAILPVRLIDEAL